MLGRPDDAVPVAAALAGGLREQHRAAGALLVGVAVRRRRRARRSGRRRRPGWPRASRPAGSTAVARGRLAWLALGSDELALAARAVAAVDVPAVIAITGPRTAATDDLLAEQDLVVLVVARRRGARARGAHARRPADCAAPVVVQRPLDSPGARPAAMAGWGAVVRA